MNKNVRTDLGWPAAATIITAMIGAVAGSIALALGPSSSPDVASTIPYASAREIGEVKARLEAIENANHRMREELRDDIKELRKLVQVALETR